MPSILQGRNREAAPPPQHAAADMHMPEHDAGTGEARSTLVSHGDGSHHIEHEDGTQTEHPHIGHALMHLGAKHSEGMHHHTHSDGMGGGHTVHTAAHGSGPMDSEEHGPHEMDGADGAAEHLKAFFGEEDGEGDGRDGKDGEKPEGKDYD